MRYSNSTIWIQKLLITGSPSKKKNNPKYSLCCQILRACLKHPTASKLICPITSCCPPLQPGEDGLCNVHWELEKAHQFSASGALCGKDRNKRSDWFVPGQAPAQCGSAQLKCSRVSRGRAKPFPRVVGHQIFRALCPLSPDNLGKNQRLSRLPVFFWWSPAPVPNHRNALKSSGSGKTSCTCLFLGELFSKPSPAASQLPHHSLLPPSFVTQTSPWGWGFGPGKTVNVKERALLMRG